MSNNASLGISIGGLLGVAFIVLKLCHVINWSWWWVLCPFWIGLTIVLIIVLVIVAVIVATAMLKDKA